MRAISTAIGYVLNISIATLLIAGLVLTGGAFVDDQREQAIEKELEVIGEHIARNIQQVDRYAIASEDAGGSGALESAAITQSFPQRVIGSTYDIELGTGQNGAAQLTLTSASTSDSINVTFETHSGVEDSVVDGGTVTTKCNDTECDAIVLEGGG